jgi:formate dehydrogenase (NADP+) beta subunit
MGGSDRKDNAFSPCRTACPAGVDVPRYIRHIRNGEFDKALATIREKIPFPSVCGHACVAYCEIKCARIQYDEAVAIRLLKRAAAEHARRSETPGNAAPTGKKVAVVGAGPGGLTAAYFLVLKGHRTTVFDTMPEPGGMLRYGIPEYRLPNNVLKQEISLIREQGVEIETGARIESPAELLEKGFDAVLVASGAWKAQTIGIEGEALLHVLDGIAFLTDVNTGKDPRIGKRVVVVGGGDTAIDAARAAVRLGADVRLIYRRGRSEMPASANEIEEAVEEGVTMEFLAAPVRIAVSSVECIRMELGTPGADGRPRPVPMPGSGYALECDTVIMAVGQSADAGFLGLAANRNGTARVDGDSLATSHKGIFAAGDVALGPSSVIDAIAQGRKAAISIDRYLGGDGIIDTTEEEYPNDRKIPDPEPDGTSRAAADMAPLEVRLGGFDLAEKGYDRETAMREACRCLSCDLRDYGIEVNSLLCKDCGYCKEVCTLGVFQTSDAFNPAGYHPMVASKSDQCIGCLYCLYVCPDFAIRIKGDDDAA